MLTGALLQKYPVHMVVSINIFSWGIVTACTAAVHNRKDLIAIRALLGIFEALIYSALMMMTSA